ncbi:uncharacterized protein LOC105698493 isoform X2 [Orussus abietinus]|nr:uncharacterized protein LOC105698493 isoform X2 [Orussus abietinus]
MRMYAVSEPAKSASKSAIGQRVMSAKMLRVKQLQNQLSDAHYHLNELANENRLLKALQKRQDTALRRYEGTNAELPRIIHSHHEELRVLQTKYKKLKAQHHATCCLLKDKENELHALQSQNRHLLQLSKDRNLGEREKLQTEVSDLTHRIQQQQETIQTLNRKLTLETKSLKHQLSSEIAKHKETQKVLGDTLEKMKFLEEMLDNRERRLFASGQLPVFGKAKNLASQSLINLDGGSTTINILKPTSRGKGNQGEAQNEVLPTLATSDVADGNKLGMPLSSSTSEFLSVSPKTETMASFQQLRKFRLQRSSPGREGFSVEKLRDRTEESNAGSPEDSKRSQNVGEGDRLTLKDYERDVKRFEESLEERRGKGVYELPKELKKEFGYSSDESGSEDESRPLEETYPPLGSFSRSKELYARLISDKDGSRGTQEFSSTKKMPRSVTEEDLEKFISQEVRLSQRSVVKGTSQRIFSSSETKVRARKAGDAETFPQGDTSANEFSRNPDEMDFMEERVEVSERDATSPGENLVRLNVNASDSDSESERSTVRKGGLSSATQKDKVVSEIPDNGQLRLVNITKSWSELREKIMKDRETSERQIRALENSIKEDKLAKSETNFPSIFKDDFESLLSSKKDSEAPSRNLLKEDEDAVNEDDGKILLDSEINSEILEVSHENTECEDKAELNGLAELKRELLVLQKPRKFKEESHPGGEDFLSTVEEELLKTDAAHERLKSLVIGTDTSDEKIVRNLDEEVRERLDGSGPDSLGKLQGEVQYSVKAKIDEESMLEELKGEVSKDSRTINYNKEKLLAAMKAIDDNENIEFIDQKSRRSISSNRLQITENLYRGLPTHSKKKDDLIKEIFGEGKADNKVRNGCSKLH